MQHAGGDIEAPQHAAGVVSDRLAVAVGKAHTLKDLVNSRAEIGAAQAIQAAEEREIVAGRELLIHGHVLRHDAKRAPRLERVPHDVEPVQAGGAGVGLDRGRRGC